MVCRRCMIFDTMWLKVTQLLTKSLVNVRKNSVTTGKEIQQGKRHTTNRSKCYRVHKTHKNTARTKTAGTNKRKIPDCTTL